MKSKTGMFMSIAAAALAAYASFGATVVDDGIKDGVHGYTPDTSSRRSRRCASGSNGSRIRSLR